LQNACCELAYTQTYTQQPLRERKSKREEGERQRDRRKEGERATERDRGDLCLDRGRCTKGAG
jgi:hypothetical protein